MLIGVMCQKEEEEEEEEVSCNKKGFRIRREIM
jgi:hypothetical protein